MEHLQLTWINFNFGKIPLKYLYSPSNIWSGNGNLHVKSTWADKSTAEKQKKLGINLWYDQIYKYFLLTLMYHCKVKIRSQLLTQDRLILSILKQFFVHYSTIKLVKKKKVTILEATLTFFIIMQVNYAKKKKIFEYILKMTKTFFSQLCILFEEKNTDYVGPHFKMVVIAAKISKNSFV